MTQIHLTVLSHDDDIEYLNELNQFLLVIKRKFPVLEITKPAMPGDDIEEGLLSAVTNANVIVALISQSLIADNLLYKGLELVLKLERTKNMALIPVKIKQFFSELEKELHLLPSSGQKLSDMEDTAEAWREVARAIEICILQIKANLELIHYKNLVDRYRSKFGDIIE